MKIKRFLPVFFISLALIAVIVIWTVTKKPAKIFFYGSTCPHCQKVEEFMNQNGTRSKLSFQELEVYNDKANAQRLIQTARKCGLDTLNGVGVPLFYADGKCLVGDVDIINYLSSL